MKAVLVHDWLTGMRGGEMVLEEIAKLVPKAPIYTLVHRPGSLSPVLSSRQIHTSWLQKLSSNGKRWRGMLPLYPAAIESLPLEPCDLVISSSHCVSKGIIPPFGAYHLSYVHTPMRYAWDQREAYIASLPRFTRLAAAIMLGAMRQWDVVSSNRIDRAVANSRLVSWRMRHYWNIKAEVVPPPVDTEFFSPPEAGSDRRGKEMLMVAALVPYKRVELAMEVAHRLGRPLAVIGEGPDRRRLEKMAKGEVRFLGRVDRPKLLEAYQHASCLIVPNVEDFGIATVEALACGTPVLGVASTGTADSVRDGVEGILSESTSADSLVESGQRLLDRSWDRRALVERSEDFSRHSFRLRFQNLVDRCGYSGVLG